MAIPVISSNRASAANAKLYMAFESVRGTAPENAGVGSENYVGIRRDDATLGVTESLDTDPDLQGGRTPAAPLLNTRDGQWSLSVGVDKRIIGYHVGALLGPATVTDAKSWGFLMFKKNPSDTNTIELNGVTWTFVAASPTGNETLIGADLAATLTQLAIDLNASADTDIDDATYTASGWRLLIEADATGSAGDAYTLAADGVADVSAATLSGGGLKRHVFASGAANLPSFTLATEHTDLASGLGRFPALAGCWTNDMAVTVAPNGRAVARFSGGAVNERQLDAALVGGVALDPAYERFSNLQGGLLLADQCVAGTVESGTINYSNNFSADRTVRCPGDPDAGTVDEAIPGQASGGFQAQSRFYSPALHDLGTVSTLLRETKKVYWQFYDPADGMAVRFTLGQVTIPGAVRTYGAGSPTITVPINGQASGGTLDMLSVEILNDITEYS